MCRGNHITIRQCGQFFRIAIARGRSRIPVRNGRWQGTIRFTPSGKASYQRPHPLSCHAAGPADAEHVVSGAKIPFLRARRKRLRANEARSASFHARPRFSAAKHVRRLQRHAHRAQAEGNPIGTRHLAITG